MQNIYSLAKIMFISRSSGVKIPFHILGNLGWFPCVPSLDAGCLKVPKTSRKSLKFISHSKFQNSAQKGDAKPFSLHIPFGKKQSPIRPLGERCHIKVLAGDSDLRQLLCLIVNLRDMVWENLVFLFVSMEGAGFNNNDLCC